MPTSYSIIDHARAYLLTQYTGDANAGRSIDDLMMQHFVDVGGEELRNGKGYMDFYDNNADASIAADVQAAKTVADKAYLYWSFLSPL